jgi:hypothetical protein
MMPERRKTLPREAGDRCSNCGRFYEHEELRPYGRDGTPLCYTCAFSAERRGATIRQMVDAQGEGYSQHVKDTAEKILAARLPLTKELR